jgi:hypothetical protein
MRLTAKGTVLLLFFLACLINSNFSFSQTFVPFTERLEITSSAGPLMYLGELGGNPGKGRPFLKDVNLPSTRIGAGVDIGYRFNDLLALRLSFNKGELRGADSLVKDKGGVEIWRKVRDLHFRTAISEFYAAMEIYPSSLFGELFSGLSGLRPYGIIGIGIFHFNPQALYTSADNVSQWIDLQPLHLEGQGMKEYPGRTVYSLTQLEIPLGAGLKYDLSDNAFLAVEVLYRKTFTDYIDDVSTGYIDPNLFGKYLAQEQAEIAYYLNNRGYSSVTRTIIGDSRGNQKDNDAFFSTVLRLGFRLGSNNATPRYVRCPQF